ncbi:hypothetical protein [Candidatus Amarolinea dominans]
MQRLRGDQGAHSGGGTMIQEVRISHFKRFEADEVIDLHLAMGVR